jgi:hypothetical protein
MHVAQYNGKTRLRQPYFKSGVRIKTKIVFILQSVMLWSILSLNRSNNFLKKLAHLLTAPGVNFNCLQYNTDSMIYFKQN